MHHLAARMRDEQHDGQCPEGERSDGEQVHRPDVRPVVAQKGPPGLARWARRSAPPGPLNRALAHAEPELEQLAPDPLAPPPWVLLRYAGDQLLNLGAQPGTAEPAAGPPAPEYLPCVALPADHSVGPDQDQMVTPVATEGVDHDPEQFVRGAQPGAPSGGPGQDGELLAEKQVLGDQVGTATKHRAEETDEEE